MEEEKSSKKLHQEGKNMSLKNQSVSKRTKTIVRVAVLSALSAILYALPGIPIIPPIYKLDFSGICVFLGAMWLGPIEGIIIALFKDITGLVHSSSAGVGELADFICSVAFILPIAFFRKKADTGLKKSVVLVLSVLLMALAGAAANYWILIPFYVKGTMTIEKIVGMIAKVIPAVDSLGKLILFATVPFNLLKGAIISVIVMILDWRLEKIVR